MIYLKYLAWGIWFVVGIPVGICIGYIIWGIKKEESK